MREWWLSLLRDWLKTGESSQVSDQKARIESLEHQLNMKKCQIEVLERRVNLLEAADDLGLKLLDRVAITHGIKSQQG